MINKNMLQDFGYSGKCVFRDIYGGHRLVRCTKTALEAANDLQNNMCPDHH